MAKPIGPNDIEDTKTINPQILPRNKILAGLYDDNAICIRNWLKEHKYPVISIDRGRKLAPMSTMSKCYPTGFDIVKAGT